MNQRGRSDQVAERAGVSIGSLYQYFPNKDSIVAALISRALRHLSLETRHRLHAYIWFVFYTAYFVLMRERF